jgi:hypothetical protein
MRLLFHQLLPCRLFTQFWSTTSASDLTESIIKLALSHFQECLRKRLGDVPAGHGALRKRLLLCSD